MFAEEQIEKLEVQNIDGLKLILKTSHDAHPFNADLQKLADSLKQNISGCILSSDKTKEISQLELRTKSHRGISYSTMPLESEWHPFLETLQTLAGEKALPFLKDELETLPDEEITMEIYVTPHCPFCAKAVYLANCLAIAKPNLSCHIIDASQFMDKANNLGIRSTPAVVIENKVRRLGQIGKDDMLAILLEKEVDWVKAIKSQLVAGSIEEAVSQVLSNPESLLALAQLMLIEDLSLRVGVLGIIEDIAEKNEFDTKELSIALCTKMKHENPSIRGDLAYAIGLLKHNESLNTLKGCLDENNPDVLDTIEEAIEMIEGA